VFDGVYYYFNMKRCLSTGNVSNNDNIDDFTKVISKKAKTQKQKLKANQTSSTQSGSLTYDEPTSQVVSQMEMDNAIDSVVNQVDSGQSTHGILSSNVDSIAVNHCDKCSDQYVREIIDLKQFIVNQSVLIDTIVNRLNFVLSMFSIDEILVPSLAVDPLPSDVNYLPNKLCSNTTSVHLNAGDNSDVRSYSSVAAHNSQTNHSKEQLSKFRQSMVAAVYVDQRDKDRRSSSFIVSGLPISSNCSDQKIVADLCRNEFNIQVDISSTKRLSNSPTSSSTSAKIPPLLVSVKNLAHAKEIISSARSLRQSTTPFIRDNVYINANLTKAEASAAYELRRRRRATAGRHVTSRVSAANQTAVLGVVPDTRSSITASTLSASVPSFVPSKNSQETGQRDGPSARPPAAYSSLPLTSEHH